MSDTATEAADAGLLRLLVALDTAPEWSTVQRRAALSDFDAAVTRLQQRGLVTLSTPLGTPDRWIYLTLRGAEFAGRCP